MKRKGGVSNNSSLPGVAKAKAVGCFSSNSSEIFPISCKSSLITALPVTFFPLFFYPPPPSKVG